MTDRDPPRLGWQVLRVWHWLSHAMSQMQSCCLERERERDSDRKGVMEGECRMVGERERRRLKLMSHWRETKKSFRLNHLFILQI